MKHTLFRTVNLVNIIILILFSIVPFLLLYNLNLNPRTWHDEGDALSVARTLVEDGYYGVKVSDGFQTFGIIQSIGPTIILPIAWAFNIFGVNLVTGRIVAASFAFLCLILFFITGKAIIGKRAALIAVIVLISSPGVRYFYTGRQVMGVVPALGFFLAGVLIWYLAIKSKNFLAAIVSGLLIGCAILTKSQYLVLGLGAFSLIAMLDLFYYHLGAFKITSLAIIVAMVCYGAWNLWQWLYFGPTIYAENGEKLYLLSKVAFGIRSVNVVDGIRYLIGKDTGHYFLFWGFLSLFYIAVYGLKKDIQSLTLMLLLIFTLLWLIFTIFWTIPWNWHFFAPLSVTMFFIGKLFDDLATSIFHSGGKLKQEAVDLIKSHTPLTTGAMLTIGCLVALITFSFWTINNFENVVEMDVLDKIGEDQSHWPRSFSLPYQTADFINQTVAPATVIETSERELAILTHKNYHSPDQSILIQVIPYSYYGIGVNDYRLGSEYFDRVNPEYLVVGYFAREHHVYDMDFVLQHYEQVHIVGEGGFQYEIYQRIKPNG